MSRHPVPPALFHGDLLRNGEVAGAFFLDLMSVVVRGWTGGGSILWCVDWSVAPHRAWCVRDHRPGVTPDPEAYARAAAARPPGRDDLAGFLEFANVLAGDVAHPSALPSAPFLFELIRAHRDPRTEVQLVDGREVVAMVEMVRAAATAYLARLDPTSLALCRATGRFRADLFAAVDPAFGPRPLRDALLAHPRLANLLVGAWEADPDAIARQAPDDLIDARARAAGVPRRLDGAVRALDAAMGRLAPADLDRANTAASMTLLAESVPHGMLDAPVALARLLAALPASWVPRSDEAWDAFVDVSGAVALALQRVAERADLGACVNAKGDWVTFRGRLRAAARDPGNDPVHEVNDVRHAVHALAAQLLLPAWAIHDGRPRNWNPAFVDSVAARDDAERLVIGSRTLVAQLAQSAAWHRRAAAVAAMVACLPRTDPPAGWDACLPDDAEGGLDLRVLVTDAALAAEGAHGPDADGIPGLSHCVGGYGHACLTGGLRVASIGTASGGARRRLSTVALRVGPDDVLVTEHRGRGNAPPPPETEAFLASYLAALSAGTLGWTPAPRDGAVRAATLADACGYDWWSPGAWEAVRDAWAPLLPRGLRDASASDLAASRTPPGGRASPHRWRPRPPPRR